MKTILLASIKDNDETKRTRCPLVLVEIAQNRYQWYDLGYKGNLETIENAAPNGSAEEAIKIAKQLWRGPAWDLVISPASL